VKTEQRDSAYEGKDDRIFQPRELLRLHSAKLRDWSKSSWVVSERTDLFSTNFDFLFCVFLESLVPLLFISARAFVKMAEQTPTSVRELILT